jgi:hypothetical protein
MSDVIKNWVYLILQMESFSDFYSRFRMNASAK